MKKTVEYRRQHVRYAFGYVIAASLTFVVYIAAVTKSFSQAGIAGLALTAAALQLYVQSRYFLHLDDKEKPRWRLMSYVFTWLMLLIIVIGSLWIMMNLNYNMGMSPEQMTEYMQAQNKKGF